MKLELKHIHHYPICDNNLKVIDPNGHIAQIVGMVTIDPFIQLDHDTAPDDVIFRVMYEDGANKPEYDFAKWGISQIKPLLLPMCSLYTEMEDGTVHIVELAKIAFPKKKFELTRSGCWCGAEKFLYSEVVNSFRTLHEDGGCFSQGSEIIYQLDLFAYLFSHHFDVWNLIGQNLAIDKTKIK